MSKLFTIKPSYEAPHRARHAKYERRETRVSEYMRLYSAGKLENIPESKIPTQPDDPRSTDQMLDDAFCPEMATEPVEVMQMIEDRLVDYQKAIAELKSGSAKKRRYSQALSVMKNPQSTEAQKFEAAKVLRELRS